MPANEKQAVPLSLVTRDCKDKRQRITSQKLNQNKKKNDHHHRTSKTTNHYNKRQITNNKQRQPLQQNTQQTTNNKQQTTSTTNNDNDNNNKTHNKQHNKQHLFSLVAQNGPVAEVVDTHWTQGHWSAQAPNPSTMNPNNVCFQWLVTATLRQIPIEIAHFLSPNIDRKSFTVSGKLAFWRQHSQDNLVDYHQRLFLGWIKISLQPSLLQRTPKICWRIGFNKGALGALINQVSRTSCRKFQLIKHW